MGGVFIDLLVALRGGWQNSGPAPELGLIVMMRGEVCEDGLYTLVAVLDSTVLDSYVLEISEFSWGFSLTFYRNLKQWFLLGQWLPKILMTKISGRKILHKSDRRRLRIDSDFISITSRTVGSLRNTSAVNIYDSASSVVSVMCRLWPNQSRYRGLIPRCGQEIYLSSEVFRHYLWPTEPPLELSLTVLSFRVRTKLGCTVWTCIIISLFAFVTCTWRGVLCFTFLYFIR
jgi:hypothetical protein